MSTDDNNNNLKPKTGLMSTIFTFGASLLLLQGAAHASTNEVSAAPNANSHAAVKNDSNAAASVSAASQTLTLNNNSAANNSAANAAQGSQSSNTASSAASANSQASAVASSAAQSANTVTFNVSSLASNSTSAAAKASQLSVSLVATNTSSNSGLKNMNASRLAFLNSIKQGALDGWNQYGVLPSVTAAQAILESAWGQSALATQGHNLFGIKGSYNGQSIYMMTREVYGGQSVYVNAAFRRYDNNSESVKDHGAFLANNSRYHNLLWQTDYRTVTRLIRQDGYATDPNYTTALNNLIQTYGLDSWDQEVMNVNTGHIDDFYVDSNNNLHITGWHASTNYNSNMHHFIILVDAKTNQELARKEITGVYRQDVKNAYSSMSRGISGWGGFDLTIPYTSSLAGRNIRVVSRYTYDSKGDPNGGDSWWSNAVSASANNAYLDNFSIQNGKLHVQGWNDNDLSIKYQKHFIILWDSTKGKEIARKEVALSSSPDVAKSTSGRTYGSSNCRFSTDFDLSSEILSGDKIEVISRYSDSDNGEGNRSDYWFKNNQKSFGENNGWLDSFNIQNGKLHIAGWQATNASLLEKNHFIIVYDATKGREIERKLVLTVASSDIDKTYPNIANADKSRFNVDLDLTPEMVSGDKIEIISRYSDSTNGEGHYTDCWYSNNEKSFNKNNAWLDDFSAQNGEINTSKATSSQDEFTITATGWHADDQAVKYPRHYVILYDDTTGREVARKLVPTFNSPDVAQSNGNYDIANAGNSRFTTSFTVPISLKGHRLQIISRYTSSNDGNSNYSDFWYAPKVFY